MKNKIVILLSFLFISIIWFGCSTDKKEESTVKIGIILPLTGGGAEWGIASKNAYELSLNDLKNKYPNLNIELYFEDSETESKTASNIFNKFISIENINIVMGLLVSSNVLTIAPIAEKQKILVISNGASNPDISNAGDYIFRTWQSDALEGEEDVKYAIDSLKWKKIIIMYSENGYGKGLADVFEKGLKSRNIVPVLIESFKIGQKNFRNIIAKLGSKSLDGIYIASYPTESSLLLTQMQEMKLSYSILGTQSFDDPVVKKVLTQFNFPIYYSKPLPADTLNIKVKTFIAEYKKTYGVSPGITADAAYDALQLIALAINNQGNDLEKIKKFLYSTKNYNGVSGKLSFNKFGDVEKPFIFIKN